MAAEPDVELVNGSSAAEEARARLCPRNGLHDDIALVGLRPVVPTRA